MKKISIPWAHWYENNGYELEFPDNWNVRTASMNDAPALSAAEIKAGIEKPFGAETLEKIAQGRKTVAIVFDDISRPTQGSVILPLVIEKLERAGISKNNIRIIFALGAHRPMTREDMLKKIGPEIFGQVEALNHHPFRNLVNLGTSAMGTPIEVNRNFVEADLKISIGTIFPHPNAGFGGGAKNIIPGIAGIKTLEANHSAVIHVGPKETTVTSYLGNPETPLRRDIEDIVSKVGLDFIINVVVNSRQKAAGVFAGDPVKAHREAVKFAKKVFKTEVPGSISVAVCNAYPKDTELSQVTNAVNVFVSSKKPLLADDASVVITTAGSEGAGFHSLGGPGMTIFVPFEIYFGKRLNGRRWFLFCPNMTKADVKQFYSGPVTNFYNDWPALIRDLRDIHGDKAETVVFPEGCMQLIDVLD